MKVYIFEVYTQYEGTSHVSVYSTLEIARKAAVEYFSKLDDPLIEGCITPHVLDSGFINDSIYEYGFDDGKFFERKAYA